MRLIFLTLVLLQLTACSLLMHADVGWTTRPGHEQQGIVVTAQQGMSLNAKDLNWGEQPWVGSYGPGFGMRVRSYMGPATAVPLTTLEFAPQGYIAASPNEFVGIYGRFSPYVGPSFHPDHARFSFSPTAQVGGWTCIAALRGCLFLSGFGGYDLVSQHRAWSMGLQLGYGLGVVINPDPPDCLTGACVP